MKPRISITRPLPLVVRERIPLKQGLKLGYGGKFASVGRVRERIPLKQGLKLPIIKNLLNIIGGVRERIPLKQGLKPYLVAQDKRQILSQREDSIKTRIETKDYTLISPGLYASERGFH